MSVNVTLLCLCIGLSVTLPLSPPSPPPPPPLSLSLSFKHLVFQAPVSFKHHFKKEKLFTVFEHKLQTDIHPFSVSVSVPLPPPPPQHTHTYSPHIYSPSLPSMFSSLSCFHIHYQKCSGIVLSMKNGSICWIRKFINRRKNCLNKLEVK